jgi:hypothetical protein
MTVVRSLAVTMASCTLAACAIHPLPEDVANIPTYTIVRQIRCEARQAVIDSLFRYLTSPQNLGEHLDVHSYKVGRQAYADYKDDPDSITKFKPARLTGFASSVVGLLYHTGIAYNFDLTGLEINNIDATANFIRPKPVSSLLTLGLGANFDRQRQNDRSFTITDNFGELVSKVHANYCTNHIATANYVYPIAGRVGIDRVIHDFLFLTLFANLSGKSKDVITASGPPTMVEQLQFVTTIGGSATPKITFMPTGGAFQLGDVSLPVSASRKDTHQLTIGLYLDQTAVKQIGRVRAGIFSGAFITASGGIAEQGAAKAVEQFLAQKVFKPTIIVGQ